MERINVDEFEFKPDHHLVIVNQADEVLTVGFNPVDRRLGVGIISVFNVYLGKLNQLGKLIASDGSEITSLEMKWIPGDQQVFRRIHIDLDRSLKK